MGGVASAVGSAVGFVGDAISNVAEFAVDSIIKPVISGTNGLIKSLAEDPIGTIIQVGAAATGNPFIIAAAAAATTAMNGGDVGDVLLSAAASYAGAKFGKVAGDFVAAEVGQAVGSQAVGNVAGKAAAGAIRGGLSAAVTGGDILGGVLNGGLSGAASGTFAEVGDFVKSEFATNIADDTRIPDSPTDFANFEDFDVNFTEAKGSVSAELTDLVDGYQELPDIVKDMIEGGASSAISSLITTGEINEGLVGGAIASAALSAGVIKPIIQGNKAAFDPSTREGRTRAAMLTQVVDGTVRRVYAGADPAKAFQASLNSASMNQISVALEEATGGGLERLIDEITGAQGVVNERFEEATNLAGVRNQAAIDANEQADKVNALIDQYNADIVANEEGVVLIDTQEKADARISIIDNEKEILNNLLSRFDVADNAFNEASVAYNVATDELIRQEQFIDELLVPANQIATKEIVNVLTSQDGEVVFNEEEYREIHNLSEDQDAHEHWVNTGRVNSVNAEQQEFRVRGLVEQQISDILMADAGSRVFDFQDVEDTREAAEQALLDATGADSLADPEVMQTFADDPFIARAGALNHLNTLGTIPVDPTGAPPTPENLAKLEQATNPDISYAEDVTDIDVARGKALAVINNVAGQVGIEFRKLPSFGAQVFDPVTQQYVQPVHSAEDNRTLFLNPQTGDVIAGAVGASVLLGGTGSDEVPIKALFPDARVDVLTGAEANAIEVRKLAPPPPNLVQLKERNPLIAINAAGKIEIDTEQYKELDFVTRSFLDFSKNVSEAANEYAASRVADLSEDATEFEKAAAEQAVYNVKLAAGAALDAGGELAQAFNGVVTFFRNSRNQPIDARDTNLGKVSQAIMDIGVATQPEEYNKIITSLRQEFEAAEGFGGTVEAIYEGFKKAPAEFLTEFVAKEVIQEVPLIIASGGAGLLAKGAAGAASASKTLAATIGNVTGVTTNATLQVLETAGATAAETYAEVFDEAVKMGIAPERAAVIAQEAGITNGVTASLIEGTLGRVFSPGDMIAGRIGRGKIEGAELFGKALNNIAARGAQIAGEGVSEGLEEVAATYYKVSVLEKINPAITQEGGRYEDLSGALTNAGVMGFIGGTGVASTITTAGAIPDAINAGTFTGGAPGEPSVDPSAYADPSKPTPTFSNPIANAVVAFNPLINQAVSLSNSPDETVRTQAQQTIKDTFAYDSFVDDGGVILDITQDPDGAFSFKVATEILDATNDSAFTTFNEVQEAYGDIVDQAPFKLDDNRLLGFAGEREDADIGQRVTDAVNEGFVGQLFEEQGYKPTDEEVEEAISEAGGGLFTEELGTALSERFDPQAVTSEEVQQAFADLGFFDATTTDIEQLTGQYAESELATRAKDRLPVATYNAIAEIVGKPARNVTDADVDFVSDLIAQQEVLTEPAPFTQQQLQFDVTGDRVVDVADQTVLQNLQQAQQATQQTGVDTATAIQNQLAVTSPFRDTGITGELRRMRQGQQQQQQRQMLASLGQPARGTVETPEAKQISYFFDPITSPDIFATPQQAGMFVNPYTRRAAKGGLVEDTTDKILRIVGGNNG